MSNSFGQRLDLDASVYSHCYDGLYKILQFQTVSLCHAFPVVLGIVSIARMFSRKIGRGNIM